jgi:hypothetical protein
VFARRDFDIVVGIYFGRDTDHLVRGALEGLRVVSAACRKRVLI